jgi:hypothetical protein
MAAAVGRPELAPVFYYGKDFGSKKQKIRGGKLVQEKYKELSVTKAGALGEQIEEQEIAAQAEKQEIAAQAEKQENVKNAQATAQFEEPTSFEDLLNIIGRG